MRRTHQPSPSFYYYMAGILILFFAPILGFALSLLGPIGRYIVIFIIAVIAIGIDVWNQK